MHIMDQVILLILNMMECSSLKILLVIYRPLTLDKTSLLLKLLHLTKEMHSSMLNLILALLMAIDLPRCQEVIMLMKLEAINSLGRIQKYIHNKILLFPKLSKRMIRISIHSWLL
jgi:hypothetical protein